MLPAAQPPPPAAAHLTRRRSPAPLPPPPPGSYNAEGDLLVTCGKDSNINLWWADNGVRAGSFDGHNGVVWTVDMTFDSSVLLSAAGDSSARLWDMRTGEELFRFRFNEPARASKFSVGEKLAALSTDPFMNSVRPGECPARPS